MVLIAVHIHQCTAGNFIANSASLIHSAGSNNNTNWSPQSRFEKLLAVKYQGNVDGSFEPARHPAPYFFTFAYFLPPPPRNLLSHPQIAVVHLSTGHGKWLRTASPAMLVYSGDLQDDRKDDRTGLFGADP